jgi:hypothetical protein
MIWQEHVPVIVMITRLFEKNKVKKKNNLTFFVFAKLNFYSIRQNANDIFQSYKRVNMDHFIFKSNQQSINMIMKYED